MSAATSEFDQSGGLSTVNHSRRMKRIPRFVQFSCRKDQSLIQYSIDKKAVIGMAPASHIRHCSLANWRRRISAKRKYYQGAPANKVETSQQPRVKSQRTSSEDGLHDRSQRVEGTKSGNVATRELMLATSCQMLSSAASKVINWSCLQPQTGL